MIAPVKRFLGRAARRSRLGFGLAAGLTALAAGCTSGDAPLDVIDPESVPANPTFADIEPIILRSCQPCHDGGQDPPLATCDDIVANASEIEDTALDDNTMPPGAWPRLTSREKLLLERWIDDGAPASCP